MYKRQVLGIATVTLPPKNEELVMDLCEAVNHIFMEIFDFIMIFLAPAIFCIISVQISALGMDVLLSLVRLLLMTIGICLIICGVSMAVMCAVTGTRRPRAFEGHGEAPVYGVRYRGRHPYDSLSD